MPLRAPTRSCDRCGIPTAVKVYITSDTGLCEKCYRKHDSFDRKFREWWESLPFDVFIYTVGFSSLVIVVLTLIQYLTGR